MEGIMTYAQTFFGWLLQTTLIASVVICLILLIQKTLGGKLGPRWCHALWLVLLMRMILPWAPSSRLSLSNLIPSWNGQTQSKQLPDANERQDVSVPGQTAETSEAITSQKPESETSTQEQAAPRPRTLANAEAQSGPRLIAIRRILPILWLAGAIVIGVYLLVSDLALWRIVKRDRPLLNQSMLELFEECKAQVGVQSLVVVVPSEQVRSPGLFGFVRPRLLLPREMLDTATTEEMRYVFLHELAHLKRHDIYLGWLTSLLQVLHWFNPLVWFAFYRMRADRELACDALVLTRTGQDKSQEYGGAIVGLVRRFSRSRPLPAMAGVIESKSQLKRRIAMITQFKNNSYRWSVMGIGIIVVLGTISITDPTRNTVSASSAPEGKAAMTIRLVEKDCTSLESVSPDGKYLCDCDRKEGTITIREFATGETRTIKPTQDDPDWQPNYFWPLLMSPDNKTIAYGVWGGEGALCLCLIGADGSGQRVVCPNVRPAQWFPDSSRILGTLEPEQPNDSNRNIVSISISDGSVQKVKDLKSPYGRTGAYGLALSPDARYVASDVLQDPSYKCDIVVVEIDSKEAIPLVQHPADDRLLGWTPDGRHIFFASNRTGQWDAYLLPVAKGKAQGTPERIVRNVNIQSAMLKGFAQNGSYYYQVAYDSGTVYTAGIDLTAGRLLSPPAPLGAAGASSCADWSPDGTRIAYCTRDYTSDRSPLAIRLHTLATGEERELPHRLASIGCLRWSRDGRSLLASGLMPLRFDAEKDQQYLRVCRIDVETGDSTILLQAPYDEGNRVRRAELSPDEKTLFYSVGFNWMPVAVVRRQIDTGEEKKIFEIQKSKFGWFHWALSPNGEYIALGFNDESGQSKISIIPSQGGPELQRWDKIGRGLEDIAWSTDSKTVLFVGLKPKDPLREPILEFWQVTMEGGQPRNISETDGWRCRSLRVHPDGRRIAFATEMYRYELWVMENFLPEGMGK